MPVRRCNVDKADANKASDDDGEDAETPQDDFMTWMCNWLEVLLQEQPNPIVESFSDKLKSLSRVISLLCEENNGLKSIMAELHLDKAPNAKKRNLPKNGAKKKSQP